MKRTASLAILVLASSSFSSSGQEARYGCLSETNKLLESVGLSEDKIERKQDFTEYAGGRARRVAGYHVRVWPKDCQGQFMIDMNGACQVTNTYSTGDCAFQGHDQAQ